MDVAIVNRIGELSFHVVHTAQIFQKCISEKLWFVMNVGHRPVLEKRAEGLTEVTLLQIFYRSVPLQPLLTVCRRLA